ncbi:MAG: GNAT family N-acetyltransferase [bacterium]|nr:GNAT family N-acetyltransferase [bacterium]
MQDFEITVSESPRPELVARLQAGLTEHARSFVDAPGFQSLSVFAADAEGDLAGGTAGKVNWNWLSVNLLWVAAAHRRRGLGSLLLERIEAEARRRGCRHSHLDTFTYQARAFYESNGYAVFAALDDYPTGHSRLFLRKDL